jgi:hypothetical protein
LTKSIQCLDEIIADYPKTEVVKLIKEEKDKILFESHCNSKNLDSIYLFINVNRRGMDMAKHTIRSTILVMHGMNVM